MKKLIRIGIWFVFIGLIAINVHIFVSSIALSRNLSEYEQKIADLHKENIILETKLYDISSYQYAASMSAVMNFVKPSRPILLNTIEYAYNKGL